MKTVSIHDAKTNLSRYIAAVKRGEVIYIGSYGKPEVKLIVETPKKPQRQIGLLKGKISGEIVNLDYDDHSDKMWVEIVDDMNNGSIFPR